MILRSSCQHCKCHIEYDDTDYDGQLVECPHCGVGTALYIPRVKMPASTAPAIPLTWQEEAQLQRKHRPNATVFVFAFLLFITIVFFGTVVMPGNNFTPVMIVGAIYLLPAMVGWKKVNATGILLLNLFLGWTFIGWIGALIWAVTGEEQ